MDDFNKRIRILICDDHELVRSGIRNILESQNWIYIAGEAENGEDMIRKNESLRPDMILADISMPGMSGIDAVKKIKQNYPNVIVLFLSMLFDEQYIYCSILVKASGLISKNISKDELLYAIQEVNSGRKYFGPLYDERKIREIVRKFEGIEHLSSPIISVKLTDREEEVIQYISQGFMSEDIAAKLNLGRRTIDKVRSNIMQKFELKSLPELIGFAVRYTERKK
jgi:DNA-binding NarL/FixJ family response regulator